MESNVKHAKGPTILMGSGVYFDYVDPDSTPITIEDYAYGLAFECRFRGQCVSRRTGKRVFYSVAQHAVLCSQQAPIDGQYFGRQEDQFELLMHESGEPVCGDMVSPLKTIVPEFKAVEKRCEVSVGRHFGVKGDRHAMVKGIDLRMWATERRDLMKWDGKPWGGDGGGLKDGFGDPPGGRIEPFNFEIVPIEDPQKAAVYFLDRWHELGGPRRFAHAQEEIFRGHP